VGVPAGRGRFGCRPAEILRADGNPWQLSNCLALTLMALHWSARLEEARQVADTLEALSARVPDHGATATIS
jgi:hypothetical protein